MKRYFPTIISDDMSLESLPKAIPRRAASSALETRFLNQLLLGYDVSQPASTRIVSQHLLLTDRRKEVIAIINDTLELLESNNEEQRSINVDQPLEQCAQ